MAAYQLFVNRKKYIACSKLFITTNSKGEIIKMVKL